MENMKICCPICDTIGERNTFCETCRWFLNDSLDYYSLSPLSSEAIGKFNDNIRNYKMLWKNFAEKEQQQKEIDSVALNEIIKMQDQQEELQEMLEEQLEILEDQQEALEAFAQRFDLLENKILSSSINKSNAKAMPEESQQFQAEILSKKEDRYELPNDLDVGSSCFFGSYPDNESIEWLVLEKKNNKVLVVSKYALDCKPYNTIQNHMTWEDCTLRNWLNFDFIKSAFTAAEQEKILTVCVSADENPKYSTAAGRDTLDKIFLLSILEAKKYFKAKSDRQSKPTAYAKENGVYTYSSDGNCRWWLRSPGDNQSYASYVSVDGDIDAFGNVVYYDHYAVRPALWINLNA